MCSEGASAVVVAHVLRQQRSPGIVPRIIAVGLTLQAVGLAWLAAVSTPTVPYSHLVLPFILSGIGMGLFFAPVANVILSSVRPVEEGQASGANNAIRELGGVFGVAVLASIFAAAGSYETGPTFTDGMNAAVFVGAAVVAVGALVAFLIPVRSGRTPLGAPDPAVESAGALETA